MEKLRSETKRFNKGYVPVIISSLFLLVLLVGLIVVILVKPTEDKEEEKKKDDSLRQNEIVVDTSSLKCSKDDINKLVKEASNITVNYKVSEKEIGEPVLDEANSTPDEPVYIKDTVYAYDINFENVTEDVKLVITNDNASNTYTFTGDDIKDGKVGFVTEHVLETIRYTVTIYSNEGECKDSVVRKFTFETPMFNPWSDMTMCSDSESELCKATTYDDEKINVNKMAKDVEKEKEEKEEAKSKKDYGILIAILIVMVVIGVVAYILIQHRKLVKNHA